MRDQQSDVGDENGLRDQCKHTIHHHPSGQPDDDLHLQKWEVLGHCFALHQKPVCEEVSPVY